jgi:hypothetical protein
MPPPEHIHSRPGESATGFLDAFFKVQDVDAVMFLVRDVQGLEGADMRWTYAEPEFRFFLRSAGKLKYVSTFTVHSATFKDTGPLNIVFLVNGRELARQRYDAPGPQRFEKPVPDDWLKRGAENRVIMKIVNPWKAPDGVLLGVVLHSAGFVE